MGKIVLINVITVIIFVILYLSIFSIIPLQYYNTLVINGTFTNKVTFGDRIIFSIVAPFSYFENLGLNKYTFFANSIGVIILMTILVFINKFFKNNKMSLFPFRIFISGIIATIIVCGELNFITNRISTGTSILSLFTAVGIIWFIYNNKLINDNKIVKIILLAIMLLIMFLYFTTPSYKSNVIHFFGLIVSTIVYFALERPVNKLYEVLGGDNDENNKTILTK